MPEKNQKLQRSIHAYKKTISWTTEQEELILEHKMTDHELSEKIGHSVKAIQIKRCRLKKEL